MSENKEKQSLLEIATTAYRNEVVRQVIEIINRLNFPIENISEVFSEAYRSDDRSCAILLFSLVDQIIISLFEQALIKKDRNFNEQILGHRGILPTASSRITMAHALGWLRSDTIQNINILRNVRNKFAHNVRLKSFSDQQIKGHLTSFNFSAMNNLDIMMDAMKCFNTDLKETITVEMIKFEKLHYCISASFIISDLSQQMCAAPLSYRHGISPNHVLSAPWQDDGLLTLIRLEFTKAIFIVLQDWHPHESFKKVVG